MRRWVIAVATLAMLAIVNFGIWQRENLLQSGRVVLLELVPVDPRSLVQGDFMRLSYRTIGEAFPDRPAFMRQPPPLATSLRISMWKFSLPCLEPAFRIRARCVIGHCWHSRAPRPIASVPAPSPRLRFPP